MHTGIPHENNSSCGLNTFTIGAKDEQQQIEKEARERNFCLSLFPSLSSFRSNWALPHRRYYYYRSYLLSHRIDDARSSDPWGKTQREHLTPWCLVRACKINGQQIIDCHLPMICTSTWSFSNPSTYADAHIIRCPTGRFRWHRTAAMRRCSSHFDRHILLILHSDPRRRWWLDDSSRGEKGRAGEQQLVPMMLLLLLTSVVASKCELDAYDLSAVYIWVGKATRTIRQILTSTINPVQHK